MKVDTLKQAPLPIVLAITAGVLVSVLMGALIGAAHFSTLKRLTFVLLACAYFLFWQRHTWKVALAVCLFGFSHVGFGFRITIIELSGLVAAFLIAATWWRKQRLARPKVMELFSFRVFNVALIAWLLYSSGHAVYTIMDPISPYEFALKNFLKTIVAMTGPPLLIFYFMHRPRGIESDKNMLVSIVTIGLAALIANILIRLWGMFFGIYNLDIVADLGEDAGFFTIPGLDLTEDPYALRSLTPLTATICAILFKTPWLRRQAPHFRILVYLLFGLSFVGAALSGGRATLVFVFLLTGMTLWFRGQYRIVGAAIGVALFVLIALNLIPGVLRTVPPVLQRSLQAVIFTDRSEFATADISSSTEWRVEIVQRAFNEWRSDSRIFWFGRGTYKFGMEDYIARQLNNSRGAMETALRRGATHSLVTDLLVVYGLCGFVIYFLMAISLLCFLWRVYRHPSIDEVARMLTLTCFILLVFTFAYGIVAGAILPVSVAWLLIALFGYFFGLAKSSPADIDLARTRRLEPLRPGAVVRPQLLMHSISGRKQRA